ncbi:MAG TPA: DUF543 domain-containing protein [Desulfobacteraceae bacterium]|nr:DUF543 domain-containing protein [Desulfobacteraceae bacterium]
MARTAGVSVSVGIGVGIGIVYFSCSAFFPRADS